METSDFDKAIQAKLQHKDGRHQNEMVDAKLAIWSQIDHNMREKRVIPWYWPVAAAILLLISFSYVINHLQEGHRQEINGLRMELSQVQQQYELQSQTVTGKDETLTRLEVQLSQFQRQTAAAEKQTVVEVKERTVYLRDTVYLKEVQYLTEAILPLVPLDSVVQADTSVTELDEPINETKASSPTFIAIASRPTDSKNDQNIKVKFGSFTKKPRNP